MMYCFCCSKCGGTIINGECTGDGCRQPKREPIKAPPPTPKTDLEFLQGLEFSASTRYGPSCPECHANRDESWGYVERGPDRGHELGCDLRGRLDRLEAQKAKK